MTEKSRFWTTDDTGDGPAAGYVAADFYDFVRRLLIPDQEASQGVLRGVANELAVSGTSSPLGVASGSAIVYGLFYDNSAALELTVTIPITGVTGGRVNLKVDWSAQTVRAAIQLNTDGTAAIPALVQTAGSEWNISLATFTITTGGAITLTDVREVCAFASYFEPDMIDGVSGASVVGRSASSEGPADSIAASSDGLALVRSSGVLGFGQVQTAGIANDAVTADKIADDAITAGKIADGAVGTDQLADDAVTTDKIATGAVTADKIATGAVDTDQLAASAVTAVKIATGAVTADKIADNAVDDTKVGNRVIQFVKRYGGSSSDWSAAGSTSYTPTTVRMQAGSISVTIANGASSGYTSVTFPTAFSDKPLVFCTRQEGTVLSFGSVQVKDTPTASGFDCQVARTGTSGEISVDVHWLAIGPE